MWDWKFGGNSGSVGEGWNFCLSTGELLNSVAAVLLVTILSPNTKK